MFAHLYSFYLRVLQIYHLCLMLIVCFCSRLPSFFFFYTHKESLKCTVYCVTKGTQWLFWLDCQLPALKFPRELSTVRWVLFKAMLECSTCLLRFFQNN